MGLTYSRVGQNLLIDLILARLLELLAESQLIIINL